MEFSDIRPATADDATELATLWHAGWHNAHADIVAPEITAVRTRPSFDLRVTDDLVRTRVLECNGSIAAFHIIKGPELYQFYVAPEYHGRGVANILIEDVENCLRSGGTQQAWLACAIGNERASRFYKRHGWQFIGEEAFIPDPATKNLPLNIWRFEKSL